MDNIYKTICFFGHGLFYPSDETITQLKAIVEQKVLDGYNKLIMGKHGCFDSLCFELCLKLKNKYPHITICLAMTNLSYLNVKIERDADGNIVTNPKIVNDWRYEKFFYDIENEHYKNRITKTNQCMVDESDLVICYCNLDRYKSGSAKAIKYAIKKGKEIINLYPY